MLWFYLEQHGRPAAFYTDKASIFRTAPKRARDAQALARDEREPLPPTQIGRALRELGIVWIAAHSPQAKGRVERSFDTAQDRLVKGLRVAGARTLEEANGYLAEDFLPWWNQHLVIAPANATDAHRPLSPEHNLAASLSEVETRQIEQRLHPSGGWQVTGESSGVRSVPDYAERPYESSGDWMAAWPSVSATATWSHTLRSTRQTGEASQAGRSPRTSLPRKPSAAMRESMEKLFANYQDCRYGSRPRSIAPGPSTTWRSKAQAERRATSRPALCALKISEDRCSEASPKQIPPPRKRPQKPKPPERAAIGLGLTGGMAPSASEPAPSQRSSDLPQGARLPRNIASTLTPPFRSARKTGHFYLAGSRTFLFGVDRCVVALGMGGTVLPLSEGQLKEFRNGLSQVWAISSGSR